MIPVKIPPSEKMRMFVIASTSMMEYNILIQEEEMRQDNIPW